MQKKRPLFIKKPRIITKQLKKTILLLLIIIKKHILAYNNIIQ